MSYQEKTTKRILQLAKEGDFEACIELSSRYRTGTPMLEKNPVMADYWQNRAMELADYNISAIPIGTLTQWASNGNNAMACLVLSLIYSQGELGVIPDQSMAEYWGEKAEKLHPGITHELAYRIKRSFLTSKKKTDHKSPSQGCYSKSDESINSKETVLSRYQEFIATLKDCYDDLNTLQSRDKDFVKVIDEIKSKLQKQIEDVRKKASESMNATIWDHLVIAFFGETNAGKSTIIETFRILFNEKTRSCELKKHPEGVDGEIVGDGQADFTKVYSEYNMSIKGHPFTLIDVPGIEGNEEDFKDEIKKALGKAHLVFYVQGHNKQPDTKTAEKIEKYLKDWVNVYSIYNVRGGSGNYSEENERKTLFTPRVNQVAELISQTFKKILGKRYKGNISLQGLLALCAVAKFSDKRKDLQRTQRKLIKYFGTTDAFLSFSGIKAIEQIVYEKSDNFADEIIEANKQKLIKLGKDAVQGLTLTLKNNEEELEKYKTQLSNFRRFVVDRYKNAQNLIKQKINAEYNHMFDSIRSNIYSAIDNDNTEESAINAILNREAHNFNEEISKTIGNEIRLLREDINTKKRSIDLLLLSSLVDSNFQPNIAESLDLKDAFEEMDINFSDVFGLGAAVVEGAAVGSAFTFIAPGVATAVGGIVGGALHLLRKAFFGDGGKGKAKEKVRQQLNKTKTDSISELQNKIEQKVLLPLDYSRDRIEGIIRIKEGVFRTSIGSINECENLLKQFVIGLNKKQYGNI